jgi:hypothetical protein
LVLDIAHDVGARLEHDLAAANGPFDTPVHDDAVGFYAAIDNRVGRGDPRQSTLPLLADLR